MTIKLCKNCKHFEIELNVCYCKNYEVRMTANDDKAGEFLIDGNEESLAVVKCSSARKFSHLCGKNGRFFEV